MTTVISCLTAVGLQLNIISIIKYSADYFEFEWIVINHFVYKIWVKNTLCAFPEPRVQQNSRQRNALPVVS